MTSRKKDKVFAKILYLITVILPEKTLEANVYIRNNE
jgi:hypothetical protein